MVTVKQLFRDQQEYVGKEIEVGGWVRTIQDNKVLGFIELNDGSFFKTCRWFLKMASSIILRKFAK